LANINSPFGFRPVARAGGAPFSTTKYAKPASDSNTIFMFDMVHKVTGAVLLPESPTNYYLPTVQTGYQGTPGTTLWQGASMNYGAASTLTVHMVTDEIDVIYIAQSTSSTSITTSGYVGKNAPIDVSTNTGSTTTKQSGMGVGTPVTTQGDDLRVQRVAMISPNAEGEYAILEVTLNKSELGHVNGLRG
jgi:hypothetical protein